MKFKNIILFIVICFQLSVVSGQLLQNATVKEYKKTFTTYPFSDPNPIPSFTKIYPYFRFDAFTNQSIEKDWKVVELENDYIKVMILPEIGGKIWTAMYKSQITGSKSEVPFIYYNHVVKFRDISMRGPWTSGGIESNYGIIGHTANCATPVDYITFNNPDGSASCIIGSFDMLTLTYWRIEINLQKDKAYFTTKSYWYNKTEIEQPYYHWMNTGIKAAGDLEIIYSGTNYIGHDGKYFDWNINKDNGHNMSFYEQNNFGTYKSYHVIGKYTDFFGGYWHKDSYGMARYALRSEKAGKKAWIWGLSQQGMIWEKLLTDKDGQYVEVQSGRLFNQSIESSTLTPFKHYGFSPYTTDYWTEYWFPVIGTDGFVKANEYGALNLKNNKGRLKVYFSPVQQIKDTIQINSNNKIIYSKPVNLSPLKTFIDSIQSDADPKNLIVTLGHDKLVYNSNPDADILKRPVESPFDFDWESSYGLYVAGKEFMDQRMYKEAEDKLKAAIIKDKYFIPALNKMSELFYRNARYSEALGYSKTALSINTYDGEANYYYGLCNKKLGNLTDAKDGFDLASLSNEFRSPAYTQLGRIYLKENNTDKALIYADKAIDYNKYNIEALKLLCIIYRHKNDVINANKTIEQMLSIDKLNYFAYFEKYLLNPSEKNKENLSSIKRNELYEDVYLDLACDYYDNGCNYECNKVLEFIPNNTLAKYWIAWLAYLKSDISIQKSNINLLEQAVQSSPEFVFPYRTEMNNLFEWAVKSSSNWKPRFYLALLYKNENRIDEAKKLFTEAGEQPDYPPFYAARAELIKADTLGKAVADLKKAMELDKKEWRYPKLLADLYIKNNEYAQALKVAENAYKIFCNQHSLYSRQTTPYSIIGLQYAKCLMLNKNYKQADEILSGLIIIPFEGAAEGHEIYREIKLMLAISKMQKTNFSKALDYIKQSREWNENLGAGKPYDEDIDTRLEDWMNYLCSYNLNKSYQLQSSDYHVPASGSYSANSLISAWVIRLTKNNEEALKYLDSQIQKNPDDKIIKWCKLIYKNPKIKTPLKDNDDSTLRIIEELLK